MLKRARSLIRVYGKFRSEPLTRDATLRGLGRFLRWQLVSRLARVPLVMPFVGETHLIISNGMTGARGNIYYGLMEFEDMGFLLHFLSETNSFVDIGANVGVYTVLSAGVCGARTRCVEPVENTIRNLRNNLRINGLEGVVKIEHCAVGAENGEITFTADCDTTNHVLDRGEVYRGRSVTVPIRRIDDLLGEDVPTLIKIDIEGYEYPALQNAATVLKSQYCEGLIVEINGSGKKYGVGDADVDALIRSFGFYPAAYDPITRRLSALPGHGPRNTIYLKDIAAAQKKLLKAKAFSVLGRKI